MNAVPSVDEVHALLASVYKADRFEGRNGPVWGQDYSRRIAADRHQDLIKYGRSTVSRYESAHGRALWFGLDLVPHVEG